MILIYSTFPSKEAALQMGQLLLQAQLICCSNIFSITSQYFWDNNIVTDDEYGAYFKTSIANQAEAIKLIESHHPYEVPMIAHRTIEMNDNYSLWADSVMLPQKNK